MFGKSKAKMAAIPKSLERLWPSRIVHSILSTHGQPYSCFSTTSATIRSSSVSHGSVLKNSKQEAHFPDKERGRKWLLFVPGAISFGLGTWQIYRRQEKIKTLEYRQKRLQMEPVKINILSPSVRTLDNMEFRRVTCKGTFDEERSIFVGPRSRSISGVIENGYYVITPLMPIASDPDSVQSPILVNRGWIPRSWKDKWLEESEARGQTSDVAPIHRQNVEETKWWKFWSKTSNDVEDRDEAGVSITVEVNGVVRGGESPSIFVPPNDPKSGQWFYVDVPAIAVASGLPNNTLYIEDMNGKVNPSRPYPIPRDADTLICSSVMPQDHLNYTLTWYSLSAAVTFMASRRLQLKMSRR